METVKLRRGGKRVMIRMRIYWRLLSELYRVYRGVGKVPTRQQGAGKLSCKVGPLSYRRCIQQLVNNVRQKEDVQFEATRAQRRSRDIGKAGEGPRRMHTSSHLGKSI